MCCGAWWVSDKIRAGDVWQEGKFSGVTLSSFKGNAQPGAS